MANLFSLKSLKNKPHRDGFDLSFTNVMSAPIGALIPCMFNDIMPGDKIKINTSWFTRSQPCTAPAYTKFTEYVDFFFVPYHFMWRYFPDFIAQAGNNNFADTINTGGSPTYTQHPYFTKTGLDTYLQKIVDSYTLGSGANTSAYYDLFGPTNGVPRLYGIKRVFEYLGYGKINLTKNVTSGQKEFEYSSSVHHEVMNPFPLLAYNKIYNDFYRNSQWQRAIPGNFNVDYLSPFGSSMEMPISQISYDNAYSDGIFDLKYCNYNKDMITGCLPNKQFGDTALASPLVDKTGNPLISMMFTDSGAIRGITPASMEHSGGGSVKDVAVTYGQFKKDPYGISALAIRQAEFLQKWKEITQSGGTDYVSQMQKHFGVKPNSDIAHRCTYLGGITKNFGADEVVNQNLSGDNEPTIMGKCVNVGNGNIEFSSNEHGILMGIYHISILPSYDEYGDMLLGKTLPTDYVIPELDNIGMQPIYRRNFTNQTSTTPLGYVPRYSEYKSNVDQIHGAFVDTYKNWVTPTTPNLKDSVFTYASFKVSPRSLDNLFNVNYDGSYSTDQFFVNLAFDIKAVRNISRDGLPF